MEPPKILPGEPQVVVSSGDAVLSPVVVDAAPSPVVAAPPGPSEVDDLLGGPDDNGAQQQQQQQPLGDDWAPQQQQQLRVEVAAKQVQMTATKVEEVKTLIRQQRLQKLDRYARKSGWSPSAPPVGSKDQQWWQEWRNAQVEAEVGVPE